MRMEDLRKKEQKKSKANYTNGQKKKESSGILKYPYTSCWTNLTRRFFPA